MAKETSPALGQQQPWDWSQERQFIENLLCQRFNFFLLFYSLVIAGALTARSPEHFKAVLVLGALLVTLFALPLFRAQQKLDLIIAKLFEDPAHPAKLSDDLARGGAGAPWYIRWVVRGSRRRLIGYGIPLICSLSMIVGAILAVLGQIRPVP